jgi:hypothetical protein
MPALTAGYRKHVVETRLKKFYAVMNNAVRMSEAEHGDRKTWAVPVCSTSEECLDYFNEYIGQYLKTAEIKLIDEVESGTTKNFIMVSLLDGTAFTIKPSMTDAFFFPEPQRFNPENFAYTSNRIGNGSKFFGFRFDTTGKCKTYLDKGFEPYICFLPESFTRDDALSGMYACSDQGNNAMYCTVLIMLDGWKIPDDYPFSL